MDDFNNTVCVDRAENFFDPNDDRGCRRLLAAILSRAVRDAAYGPTVHKISAIKYLARDESAHLAQCLGIEEWPPGQTELEKLRIDWDSRR